MAREWAQLGASLFAVVSCSLNRVHAAPPVTEGTIDFVDPSSKVSAKTWYRIAGSLESNQEPPLVVLHGGPGVCSDYLFPLETLAEQHGGPVVIYDQVGCGRSTHFPELLNDTDFWTEQLFRDELTNLLGALKISDREYDIIGHSWGGMLGSAFATYHPKNLRRLILWSSLASMDLWVESWTGLRAQLPQDVQDTLSRHEQAGTTDSPEYVAATNVFYERHLCRVVPFPEPVQRSFAQLPADPTVYLTM